MAIKRVADASSSAMKRIINTSASTTSFTVTAAAANTNYSATFTPFLPAGIYRITCVSTTNATFAFYDANNNILANTVTSSGTVDVNLATASSSFNYYINTGTSIAITISRVASALPSITVSGTLDTITTTQTYTQQGRGMALIVGGGFAGGVGYFPGVGGAGGPSGQMVVSYVSLPGSVPVVIGSGGVGYGIFTPAAPATGGTTSFGAITSAGGVVGSGGSGGPSVPGAGSASPSFPMITPGTTGGGGCGRSGGPTGVWTGAGGGSGIGTGGQGGNSQGGGGGGTGYGAGGGGGGQALSPPGNYFPGGAGTPGVVYVVRY